MGSEAARRRSSGSTSALATLNWLAMLWTVAAAGRLEPRTEVAATDGPARTATGAAA